MRWQNGRRLEARLTPWSSASLRLSAWCSGTATVWRWWTTSRRPCCSTWAPRSCTARRTPARGSLAPRGNHASLLEVSERSHRLTPLSCFSPALCASLSTAAPPLPERRPWCLSVKLNLIRRLEVELDGRSWQLAAALTSHHEHGPLQ